MTPERFQKLKETLARRQPDLTVLADEVHKPHNLAAIIRTCDAVGIPRFHLCNPEFRDRQLRGRSMGSSRWVEVKKHDNIVEASENLKKAGVQNHSSPLLGRCPPLSRAGLYRALRSADGV